VLPRADPHHSKDFVLPLRNSLVAIMPPAVVDEGRANADDTSPNVESAKSLGRELKLLFRS